MPRDAILASAAVGLGSARGESLQLGNAEGLQVATHDATAPARSAAMGGTPRLVDEGGDHGVAYDR